MTVKLAYSQSALNDYQTCARRFYLRYVRRLAWPAVESEPVLQAEEHMRLGSAFHRLAQRYSLGIDAQLLSAEAEAAGLAYWWENFLEARQTIDELSDPQARLLPEITLQAGLDGQRLLAKFDLLAVLPGGRLTIIDWKTGARKPQRSLLQRHIQTRLYCAMLCLAGAAVNGGVAVQPAQVQMLYWFAEHPGQPERFVYSQNQFDEDLRLMRATLGEITARLPQGEAAFARTDELRACKLCVYRSYCGRGDEAGSATEFGDALYEPQSGLEIDFDSLPEVAF